MKRFWLMHLISSIGAEAAAGASKHGRGRCGLGGRKRRGEPAAKRKKRKRQKLARRAQRGKR